MSSLRRPVLAANWKMHKGPGATRSYVREFRRRYEPRSDRTVVFFPPAISIPAFRDEAGDRDDLELGVQDVHQEREGAHTGAVSAPMAADAGVGWGLAGHSERRREFGDGDELVAEKLRRLVEEGLRPVLCVGETLEERRDRRLEQVLARQVEAGLAGLEPERRARVLYAYEPVWAIGTGETAEPEDAESAHSFIRSVVRRVVPGDDGDAPILYGGSVKPHNAEALLATPEVGGVLVGSASLEPESFAAICRAADRSG